MRIAPSGNEDELELNVIPLIDVMLTLLMFFVLTTTFEHNTRLRITLPEASVQPTTSTAQDLVVLIDREGRYYVGANEVLSPSLETLKAALEAAAGDDRERRVTLRADGRTPHQAVVTAMDALGQLGFVNISIATEPGQGEN
jgi:biopolymer transport protein ExbD